MIMLNRADRLAVTCNSCDQSYDLMVNMSDVDDWMNGEYIQDAMPYLSAGERELLISKTCGSCFDEMFGTFG
jgi:hypothetical protein